MQRLIGFVAVVLAVGLACDSPSEEVAGGRAMAALEAGWAPDLAAVEVATLSEHHPNEAFPASKTRTELWVGPRAWPDDHRASLLVRFDASQVQSALDAGGSVQLVIPLVDDGDNEGFWLQRMKPRRQAWRGASVTWAFADDRAPLEPRFACHAKQRWLVADCDEREPPPTCPWGSKCSDPSPACAYVETLKGVVAGGDVVEVDGLPFEKAIVFDFTSEAEWAVTNGVMDLSWLVGGGDGSAMATVMAGSGAAPNRPHLRWALAGPDAGSPDGGMAWPEDSGTVVSPDV